MSEGRTPIGWIPESLNEHGFQTIPDILQHCHQKYADQPAFTSLGRTISYRELHEYSSAFACYLQQETGLQSGDRIAIQLPNLVQYPIALFGAMKAGLIVVNTNPLYTPREMKHQFNDSGAKALLIYQAMAHNAEEILADTGIETVMLTQPADLHPPLKRNLIHFVVKYIKKMEPDFNIPKAVSFRKMLEKYKGQQPTPVAVNAEDPAVLQYTGGTTGISKGAELSHANLISNTMQGCQAIGQAGEGWSVQVISPLPLYHIFAFTVAQAVLYTGGHNILIPNPRDIPGFVKELKKWKVTTFIGLNTLFSALCHNKDIAQVDFSHLKLTVSGGMALTQDAAEQWHKVTACTPTEGYGLTETSPVISINSPGAERIGTIGKVVKETQVKIIDDNGNALENGQAGQLCARGPQVMTGYWNRPVETEDTFTSDGYFMTGDIATQDDEGYLRILDRAKDMIIVSGFNVYPNEVEDVASSHPGIVECAAIGVPDEVCGETVKLFVVPEHGDLSVEEVRNWCKESLTAYKVPKTVEFVQELPKSNVGKVLRRMLKESAEANSA